MIWIGLFCWIFTMLVFLAFGFDLLIDYIQHRVTDRRLRDVVIRR